MSGLWQKIVRNGLKHIDQNSQIQLHFERHGDTAIRRFRLLFLHRVLRVGTDQIGQYLDIESGLRHAPAIINVTGCNANTETVSTSREKLQDKLVLDGRKSRILKKAGATRAQRMSEAREFGFHSPKHAARYLVGKHRAALRFRRQNTLSRSQSS